MIVLKAKIKGPDRRINMALIKGDVEEILVAVSRHGARVLDAYELKGGQLISLGYVYRSDVEIVEGSDMEVAS